MQIMPEREMVLCSILYSKICISFQISVTSLSVGQCQLIHKVRRQSLHHPGYPHQHTNYVPTAGTS